MGEMESGNRKRLFEESRVSNWCNIDHCTFDGVGSYTKP